MEFRNIFNRLARFFRKKESDGIHSHYALLAIISVSISLAIPSSLAADAMPEGSLEFEFHSFQVEKVFAEDELIHDATMSYSTDLQNIEMVSWDVPLQNPTSIPEAPVFVKKGSEAKIAAVIQSLQKSAEIKTGISSVTFPLSFMKSQNHLGSSLVCLDFNPASELRNFSNFSLSKYKSNRIHPGAKFVQFTPEISEQSQFIASICYGSRSCESNDLSEGVDVKSTRLGNELGEMILKKREGNKELIYHKHLNKTVGEEIFLSGMSISSIYYVQSKLVTDYKKIGGSSEICNAWENSPIKEKQIEKYSMFKTIYLWLPNRNEWHSTNFLTQCGNYPLRSMIMKSANDWKFLCSPVKTIYPSALLRFS